MKDPALHELHETPGEPELFATAERVVRSGAAPAASVAVAWRRGAAPPEAAFASAGGAEGRPARPVFDLASVTKPFVALAAARLARAGRLELAAPLGGLLPELEATAGADLPFSMLLAHRAGLEAHRTLFLPLISGRPFDRSEALREAANARRDDARGMCPEAGFAPLYSDLGYLLAGAALEALEGLPLDAIVEREVTIPLGLDVGSARQWLRRAPDFRARVLPTETVAFRGGELSGVTHDENAWALAGHGACGHAGLFGSALDVARFGLAVLDAAAGIDDTWLAAGELEPFLRERPGATLRAGFDGISSQGSSAGTLASRRTFGHLGFTGTSLWCDPDRHRATVLLSNRVCPTRDNLGIRAERPAVHDALWSFRSE